MTKKYIYGPGIDNPIVMINVSGTTETWYYYFTDALGSIRLITDDEGTIVESYVYDPFGKPFGMVDAGTDGNWLTDDTIKYLGSPLGNPYMFTARRWDSYANLYYYRFRDYQPYLGRFCQPDPLHYIDGMNLYAYCGNSPLNWLDPWGFKNTDKHMGWWLKLKRWRWQKAHDFSDVVARGWGWCLEKTEGIRGPVGATMIATGGSLGIYASLASGPPGWIIGGSAVLAEVGGILTVSDLPGCKRLMIKIKVKFKNLRRPLHEAIEEVEEGKIPSNKDCPPEDHSEEQD